MIPPAPLGGREGTGEASARAWARRQLEALPFLPRPPAPRGEGQTVTTVPERADAGRGLPVGACGHGAETLRLPLNTEPGRGSREPQEAGYSGELGDRDGVQDPSTSSFRPSPASRLLLGLWALWF